MSRNVKPAVGHVRPANIQISLRIPAVGLESSLCVFRLAKDATFLHADNEDSNQTARMRKLILVFVGHTCQRAHVFSLRLSSVEKLL